MNRSYRRLLGIMTIATVKTLLILSANCASADVVVTDVTRLLFTTDRGNLVFRGEGDFDDSLSDAHGRVDQDSTIDSDGFRGVLSASLDTAGPAEDKQAVSQITVDFTVTRPQLVTLSVPELSSEISNPTPTAFTNGALLAVGDGLTNQSDYTVFLLDNGGDFGQLDPPLDAFDSDEAILSLIDSFVLVPGDYSFGAQTVATASGGTTSTGASAASFQITFTQVPEPTTVAIMVLGLGVASYGRPRL